MFDLVTKCFYEKKNYPEYEVLKNYRKSLLANETIIEVTDFGVGSRVFKTNQRKVSAIAKNTGISPKRAELLFRITNYFQPDSVLEIGTSLGLATIALSLGNKSRSIGTKIITLEGCSQTMAIAKNQCQLQNLNNIEFVNIEFEDYLKNLQLAPKTSGRIPQLIYFDGNHSKNATL